MEKMLKCLGYAWALPVTLVGLIYVLLFNALGWYKWVGVVNDALVWMVLADKSPKWLMKQWTKWGGHTIGQVVVMKHALDSDKGRTLIVHEMEHVKQCMRLGVFQPLMYGLIYLSIKWGCDGSTDPYFSNSFEIAARRAAGQVIDVEGTVKKLKDSATK